MQKTKRLFALLLFSTQFAYAANDGYESEYGQPMGVYYQIMVRESINQDLLQRCGSSYPADANEIDNAIRDWKVRNKAQLALREDLFTVLDAGMSRYPETKQILYKEMPEGATVQTEAFGKTFEFFSQKHGKRAACDSAIRSMKSGDFDLNSKDGEKAREFVEKKLKAKRKAS